MLRKRFARLRFEIRKMLVEQDSFGLADMSQVRVVNSFCATGEGGGVDPHCGRSADTILAEAKTTKDPKKRQVLMEEWLAARRSPSVKAAQQPIKEVRQAVIPTPTSSEEHLLVGLSQAPLDAELKHYVDIGSDKTKYVTNAVTDLDPVRQRNAWTCGSAAALSIGRKWRVGPTTQQGWERLLGTDREDGTDNYKIVQAFKNLGCRVESLSNMNLRDLQQFTGGDWPVICAVQDWGGGHWLVVVDANDDYITVLDPSKDPVKGSLEQDGFKIITAERFLAAWHDKDTDGNELIRFGIAVGPKITDNAFCPTGPGGGKDNSCGPSGLHVLSDKLPKSDGEAYKVSKVTGEVRTIPYTVNPTKEELASLLDEVSNDGLRGLADSDRVVMWDAKDALHQGMANLLGVGVISSVSGEEQAAPFTVSRDGHGVSTETAGWPSTWGSDWMEKHPYFKRLGAKLDDFGRARLDMPGITFNRRYILNAFCPTGPGGGKDNSCSPTNDRIANISIKVATDAGGLAAHAEHAVATAIKDKVLQHVSKLPEPYQTAVIKSYMLGKTATGVAFAAWTASQALAEKVAEERGATPDEARKFRGVLSAIDIAAFKPIAILSAGSAVASGASWIIPPATGAYLAYSTVRNPVKVAIAASKLISESLYGFGVAAGALGGMAFNVDNRAEQLYDALVAHHWDDRYIALLAAMTDQTGDVMRAAELVGQLYGKMPTENSEDQPRDEHGRWTSGVPTPMGTAPIPEGHIRLFHYTRGDLSNIRENGLKLSSARGHTYDEPDFVWASSQPPEDHHNIVEFHVPATDHMALERPDAGTDLKKWQEGNHHVGFQRDIKPSEIIAIHEPWHDKYRYIKEHPTVEDAVRAGKHDFLLKMSDYGPAIRQVKSEPTENSFCPTGEGGGVDPTCSPPKGYVDLYHGTKPEKAAKIDREGHLTAPGDIAEGARIYLTKNPEYAKEYGPRVYKVRVKESDVERVDFESGDGAGSDEEREQIEWAAEYTYKGKHLLVYDPVKELAKAAEPEFKEGGHIIMSRGKGNTPVKLVKVEGDKLHIIGTTGEPMIVGKDRFKPYTANSFCPTGEGGGVDATCSPHSVHRMEFKGSIVEVHENPSKEQLERWIGRSKANDDGNSLRGFVQDDKAYFWEPLTETGKEVFHVDVTHRLLDISSPPLNGRFAAKMDAGQLKLEAYASPKTLKEWAVPRGITANIVGNCQPGQLRGADGRCGPGIGVSIPRDQMPQIPSDSMPDFLAWCKQRGVVVTEERIEVDSLKPTQAEFRQERVDAIAEAKLDDPLLVSDDDYILDGTHRWVKAVQLGRAEQNVLRIELPLHDALRLMRGFPGAKFVGNKSYEFHSDPAKIEAFQQWLRGQFNSILTGKNEEQLWKAYIEAGFRKGAARAFDDTKRSEAARVVGKEGADFYRGSRDQFLRDSFNQPVSVDRVKLLAGRAFDDMENVTDDMSTRMSRTMADGLVRGDSPLDIAKELDDDLDIGRTRALTVSRTEIIRAHAEGQLTALERMGVEDVGVAVEWSTTGDEKVCDLCSDLEGVVLKVSEAHGMLPRHPNCRCSFMPANVGEDDDDQVDTYAGVRDAVKESATGSRDGWGPAEPISKDRPESVALNRLSEYLTNQFCPTGVGGGIDATCPPSSKVSRVSRATLLKVRELAIRKFRKDPKPTAEEAEKNRAGMAAKGANVFRRDLLGNSQDRRVRREALLKEFGNGRICPCVYCGLKLKDGTLQQDKLYTTAQGGRYRLPNLVPACASCNQHRSDKSFETFAATLNAGVVSGLSFDDPEHDTGPYLLKGELETYYVESLGYTQYFIGGVAVDPSTILTVNAVVGPFDPDRHPRGPDGKFLHTEGSAVEHKGVPHTVVGYDHKNGKYEPRIKNAETGAVKTVTFGSLRIAAPAPMPAPSIISAVEDVSAKVFARELAKEPKPVTPFEGMREKKPLETREFPTFAGTPHHQRLLETHAPRELEAWRSAKTVHARLDVTGKADHWKYFAATYSDLKLAHNSISAADEAGVYNAGRRLGAEVHTDGTADA